MARKRALYRTDFEVLPGIEWPPIPLESASFIGVVAIVFIREVVEGGVWHINYGPSS
jgi:hypothetical protein